MRYIAIPTLKRGKSGSRWRRREGARWDPRTDSAAYGGSRKPRNEERGAQSQECAEVAMLFFGARHSY